MQILKSAALRIVLAIVLLCGAAIYAFPQGAGGVISFLVGALSTPVSSSNPLPVTGTGGGGAVTVTGTVTALAVETNSTSTLTRPANTTAYAASQLIASSTTAGSVVVPSYAASTVGGGNSLTRRWRLTTSATTGWATTLTINFWSAAPTYTNGDGGTYAVATGGAGFLGTCSITLTQWADAASGVCVPATGSEIGFVGANIFWDLQTTAAATPISGQTFRLTAEVLDNQ